MNQYLSLLFQPGEYVNFCINSVKETETYSQRNVPPGAQWICVNPLRPGTTRKQANLVERRNFVVEADDNLTPEEQLKRAKLEGVPYATAVFSGNKSVHFVISIGNSLQPQEYREYAQRLRQALPWADAACMEPARLTRCPGDTQPLLDSSKVISLEEFDNFLTMRGAPKPERRPAATVEFKKGARLTSKSALFLAGESDKETAHRDALHVAKNLFELGLNDNEVLQKLVEARRISRPFETEGYARERSKKVVEWVLTEWIQYEV